MKNRFILSTLLAFTTVSSIVSVNAQSMLKTVDVKEAGIKVTFPVANNNKIEKNTQLYQRPGGGYKVNRGSFITLYPPESSNGTAENPAVEISSIHFHTKSTTAKFTTWYRKQLANSKEIDTDGDETPVDDYWYNPSQFDKQLKAFNSGSDYLYKGYLQQNVFKKRKVGKNSYLTHNWDINTSGCISENMTFIGKTRVTIFFTAGYVRFTSCEPLYKKMDNLLSQVTFN